MTGQEQLDSRALEVAVKVQADQDNHENICALRYQGINDAVTALAHSIEVHAKEVQGNFASMYSRLWAIVGGSFLIAIGVIGFLFVKAYG